MSIKTKMLKHLKFTNRSKRLAVHLIKLKHNRFTIDTYISKLPIYLLFILIYASRNILNMFFEWTFMFY